MDPKNKQIINNKIHTVIDNYKIELIALNNNCLNFSSEKELTDLFKGVIIMFIKDIILMYNKLLQKIPDLKYSKSSEKITNLNILLDSLETDGKLFNIDCNDIILRAYVNYFYTKYRDYMMNWDIEKIKELNEEKIKEVIIDTASKENMSESVAEHLNIIPEIVLMINNLKERDILSILYLLNNLNVIIDVHLYKKLSN
jgi:hypothetical protein